MDVVHAIGAQHHHLRRLEAFLAGDGVEVGDAGGLPAGLVALDPGDPGIGAQLEGLLLQRRGQHGHVRATLGIGLAAEAFAVAAVLALAELGAVRVGVRLGSVRGRARERVVAHLLRGLGEQLAGQAGLQRRQRIVGRTGRLVHVAAGDLPALDIAGLAGDAGDLFKLVVVLLEFGIGDAPVLDRHVFRDVLPAVFFLVARADLQLAVVPAPGMAVPVRAGAADAGAHQVGTEAPVGERGLLDIVADGLGVVHRVDHHRVALAEREFVAHPRHGEVFRRRLRAAALQADHGHAGFREFLAEDAAGPAAADQHYIYFLHCLHGRSG